MSATISSCGKYRYTLEREIDTLTGKGTACFIMLNPSTADATKDDSTIRRCIGFARSWRCARLVVVNLFAYRATDPRELEAANLFGMNIIGPENDKIILPIIADAQRVVAAWGANPLAVERSEALLYEFCATKFECLGLTKSGAPKHPLYVKADTKLAIYRFGRTPHAR